MKELLPIALVTTVGAEFVTQALHEGLSGNPHIDQEIIEPCPAVSSSQSSSGGSNGTEPLAHLRWKVFYAEMLKANRAKDSFGMHEALVTAARAMIRDRALAPWERVMQYDMLKHEAKMLHWRTRGRVNCFGALPAVAAALGIQQP
jgi:hypothetical protein